ncbi:MAG: heme exporter protein CcmB [Chloroflexi bacterium]|nr:heme exporter protein CcmB [Chloroflexota bacterium]MCL5107680.1 heme exporter protein CcmB [Chloroflexota bacterium]
MLFWRKVWAILWKDIVSEWRSKDMSTSMLVFALMAVVIFNFAFELRVENVANVAPGVLWVAICFAGVLGLNRSLILEKDRGCLEGLMLCPVDRSAIYLGKMLGNVLFMLAMEVVVLPVFAVFFNLPVFTPDLLLVVLVGTLGFAGVGTLFAAIAVNTRAREVMLPVLLFPVAIPLIIAAVKSTESILTPTGVGEAPWLGLLAAFAAIFLVVATLTFEYVLEE